MTDALKPCPFCGDKPTLHVSHRGDDLAALACENDQCSIGPATDYLPDAQLAAAWNRRAPQPSPATDALADELERLKTYENRGAFAKVAFFHREAIISALREREPVAWRWRKRGTEGPWFTGTSPVEGPGAADFYEVQPLYTAPTQEHQEEQS